MDPLITLDELSLRIDHPRLRILDATVFLRPREDGPGYRIEKGRAAWEAARIPGSQHADLVEDLSAPHLEGSALRFTLPSKTRFAEGLGRLGVGDGDEIVLYDRAGSMWAARLWWMLRALGLDNAAVLDGGWRAWRDGGHTVATGPAAPPEARAAPIVRERYGLFTGRSEVRAFVESGEGAPSCLIDALPESVFRGETQNYARPGHIPGAHNLPAASLIDAAGRYRPLEELRARFSAVLEGRGPDDRIVTYCGGGIAASSDAFVLHRLGFANVAVYDGSLTDWTSDPSLPMEVG